MYQNDGSGTWWTQVTAGTCSNVFAGIILLFLLPLVLLWANRVGLEPLATPTPVVPTSTPIPVLIVTRSPEERKFSRYIASVRQIIHIMTNNSGYNTIVRQYWKDILKSGSTGGCLNVPFPELPEDYVLPPALVIEAPAELIAAVDNINMGLALSRQSWRLFEEFCGDEDTFIDANTYYISADTAQRAFKQAEEQIAAADLKIKGLDQP